MVVYVLALSGIVSYTRKNVGALMCNSYSVSTI